MALFESHELEHTRVELRRHCIIFTTTCERGKTALYGLLLKDKECNTTAEKRRESQRKFSEVRVGFIFDASGRAHATA